MFFMALALAAILPPPQPMAIEVVRDPINDGVRAFATLRDGGDRLVVSCEPYEYDGPRVSFHARRWLMRGNLFTGERPITFRFDDQPSRREMWDINDRRGQLSGQGRVAGFLADLERSDKLVIRTRDIENHRYDLTFRLIGVRYAVEQAL